MSSEFWSDSEKLGGIADVFENNGLAKKGICKYMKTHGMQIDGAEGATHKFLKTKESKKRRDYVWNDRSEVASHAAGRDANFVEVRQGKELAGLVGTSWDIIPFG